MNDGKTTAGYSLPARTLHWIMAALILFNLLLGFVIARDWSGPVHDWLYNLHRSIGALIIPLILIRFAYRLTHPAPPLPDDMPPYQHVAALATHWGLYGLLLVQPFLGWVGTSAFPAPIPVFGLFVLPAIWPPDHELSGRLLTIHAGVGATIAALVALHIAAALYHHFWRRDHVLLRMVYG
jgi:cytochrome b561